MRRNQRQIPADPQYAVLQAVAAVRGVDPIDLTVPLYESIDPDVLDELFESACVEELSITFDYHGHEVRITEDMTVAVDGASVEV